MPVKLKELSHAKLNLFLKIISKLKKERTVHFSDLFRNSNTKGLI